MVVVKLSADGREKLRYTGTFLPNSTPQAPALAAYFRAPSVTRAYTTFAQGDRLHEFYFLDRWYNVLALYDGDSNRLKGWYCDIGRVVLEADTLRFTDLALDLWVYPNGETLLLDEDEFAALPLSPTIREHCWQGVSQLQQLARGLLLPF